MLRGELTIVATAPLLLERRVPANTAGTSPPGRSGKGAMKRKVITVIAALLITMVAVPARAQHGGGHAGPVVHAGGLYGYGYPLGHSYWYDPYWYGAYGYGYPPPAAFLGGVRIKGAPRDAQVYVDGAYAGIVDDFDGLFQRLTLEPGPHQIEVRMPGVSPVTFDVNVQVGRTLTIRP